MKTLQISLLLGIVGYWFLLIESTVLPFPFVFTFATLVLILFRNTKALLFALFLGLFSDALRVNNFSLTPIFIFLTFLVVLLYENYFGKNDIVALIAILILSTLIYSYFLAFSFFYIFLLIFLVLLIWVLMFAFNFSKK